MSALAQKASAPLAGLTQSKSGMRSFTFTAPHRLVEFDEAVHLAEPDNELGPGKWTRPLGDPTLAERFLRLEPSDDALARYFHPIGHPYSGGGRRSITPEEARVFGLAAHIATNDLRTFHGSLKVYLEAMAAVRRDRRAAGDYVVPIMKSTGWRFAAEAKGSIKLNITLRSTDKRCHWVNSKHHDERRYLACHVFLNDILQSLLEDRFVLRAQLRRSAEFEASHPIHYEPRDVLGAILFQALGDLADGRHLKTCVGCGSTFQSPRSHAKWCSVACRKQGSRRGKLEARVKAVQQ